MKWIKDSTGRFPKRPHYLPEELDASCEAIVREFLIDRHGRVDYPIRTDDLTVLLEREEEKEEEDRHHHKVKMVVDGVPVEVAFEEQEKLGDLIPRALEEAGHVYKPEDRWQVKYDGKVLDLATKMCDLKLPKDATLFLSLEAGTLG